MSDEGDTGALFDSDTDALAVVVAHCVMRRFDSMVGSPLLTSPVVFEATRQVLRIVFGRETNPLKALDEIEELEAALRGGGEVETDHRNRP